MEAVVECALTVKCCRQQQQQRLHLTRAICEARTRLQQQLLLPASNCCCCPVLGMQQAEPMLADNGLLEILIFVCGNCNNCCCNQPMQKSPTSSRRWQICKSRCSVRYAKRREGSGMGLEVGGWPWPSFRWCCH